MTWVIDRECAREGCHRGAEPRATAAWRRRYCSACLAAAYWARGRGWDARIWLESAPPVSRRSIPPMSAPQRRALRWVESGLGPRPTPCTLRSLRRAGAAVMDGPHWRLTETALEDGSWRE